MTTTVLVTDIRYTPAPRYLRESGLMGWALARLDGKWQLDGLAVRRCENGGRYTISFPSRRDSNGFERPFLKPLDADTRAAVETAVLEHVRRGGWIT